MSQATLPATRRFTWEHWVGLLGLVLLLVGSYIGLFVAPRERFMGEVMRILYIHVPLNWTMLLCFSAPFLIATISLWTGKPKWDAALAGVVEAGVLISTAGLVTGMIWAKPTWGVWWSWDVRLTWTLVMLIMFAGVMILRQFVPEASRRAAWCAVASIIASVNAPLVYFSVQWWRSIHQTQSSPETVHETMQLPLRINAFAVLFLAIYFATRRARLELARRDAEDVPLPAPVTSRTSSAAAGGS